MQPSPRELIVVAKPEAKLRVGPDGITAKDEKAAQELKGILDRAGVRLRPLFGLSEKDLQERIKGSEELFNEPALMPWLYYQVVGPDKEFELLASQFREVEIIETAYIQPGAEPATVHPTVLMSPVLDSLGPAAISNCDLTGDQAYLLSGEFGINLAAAHSVRGGDGTGVEVLDVEGAWCRSHLDLIDNNVLHVGGVETSDQDWRDHGTAVLGVLCGVDNGFGITGICPKASVKTFSIFNNATDVLGSPQGVAPAILTAASSLPPGSVLVLEVHLPGPEAGFKPNSSQDGYIAPEWWPHVQSSIIYATGVRQIIVVSAAGNGGVNFEDPIYDRRLQDFPASWHNPFRRDPVDTGSILIGAGAPPLGHHGSLLGPARSRLFISNHGSALDAQAWGDEVTTTGFGPLCGATEESQYTRKFSGTSSATAIVAGAAACLQGIRKAAGETPLTSGQLRKILRCTGNRQTNFPGSDGEPPRPTTQRIGNLPDLEQMIRELSTVETVAMRGATKRSKPTRRKPALHNAVQPS